jgi:hypothetical protein
MVIVASVYLRFYIEVGVSTFLRTLTPTKFLPTPQLWSEIRDCAGAQMVQRQIKA